ncbi:MAG: fluoride efflux transporter CrcB [Bacteroidetes bacterium]|nr:MAG: fluoride efflux transporter CrcB [Bacteroidota bacterium]
MNTLLYVGVGGFTGSVLRYLIGQYMEGKISGEFPFGILLVNIVGCFLIGLVYAFVSRGEVNEGWKFFLATGFCGGFTTFSAFSHDLFSLLKTGHTVQGILYAVLSVVLGLLATILAYSLVKQ